MGGGIHPIYPTYAGGGDDRMRPMHVWLHCGLYRIMCQGPCNEAYQMYVHVRDHIETIDKEL